MTWKEFKTVTVDEPDFDGPLMVEVRLTKEKALYGADRDGRRGEVREWVEGIEIEAVYDLETGADVTEQYKDNGALESAVRKEL